MPRGLHRTTEEPAIDVVAHASGLDRKGAGGVPNLVLPLPKGIRHIAVRVLEMDGEIILLGIAIGNEAVEFDLGVGAEAILREHLSGGACEATGDGHGVERPLHPRELHGASVNIYQHLLSHDVAMTRRDGDVAEDLFAIEELEIGGSGLKLDAAILEVA